MGGLKPFRPPPLDPREALEKCRYCSIINGFTNNSGKSNKFISKNYNNYIECKQLTNKTF